MAMCVRWSVRSWRSWISGRIGRSRDKGGIGGKGERGRVFGVGIGMGMLHGIGCICICSEYESISNSIECIFLQGGCMKVHTQIQWNETSP
jgi:hypothetical protein